LYGLFLTHTASIYTHLLSATIHKPMATAQYQKVPDLTTRRLAAVEDFSKSNSSLQLQFNPYKAKVIRF